MAEASAEVEDWPYGQVLVSLGHPVKGWNYNPPENETVSHLANIRKDVTTADLVRLLDPGDSLLFTGRKQPLEVTSEYGGHHGRMSEGYVERRLKVQGPGGGKYKLTLWWHWGEGDGWADCTGLWPQVRRLKSGDLVCHLYRLAVDAPIIVPWDPELLDPDRLVRVIHEKNGQRYYGDVVGESYGSLEVDGRGPPRRQLADGPYTIDQASIVAAREVDG